MKKVLLLAGLSLAVVVAAFVGAAKAAPLEQTKHTAPQVRLDPANEVFGEAPRSPYRKVVADYVRGIMDAWPHATVLPSVDYDEVAEDIAAAVLEDPSDQPWEDAVMLASLGWWEGARYAQYVDDHRCNDLTWRAQKENAALLHHGGTCDGGLAWSLWQIHPINDVSSRLSRWCRRELMEDRRSAARCALELARVDPSLCGYTGEAAYCARGEACVCPKAKQRRDWALKALREHPFPAAWQ